MFNPALGDHYQLVAPIGSGSTGEVWQAIDTRTGEYVAAKMLRAELADDAEFRDRFAQEFGFLRQLQHPNIVVVRELLPEDRPTIVMDLMQGGSLRALLQQIGTFEPGMAVEIAASVLAGVAAAHAQGVIHRDIKPENVLLTPYWWDLRPGNIRVADFGLARLAASIDADDALGTPEYMSPELVFLGGADRRGDIYGVGILLYELVAGRTPFAGGSPAEIAQRHVDAEPPPLPIPQALWGIIAAMLDKDPARRPSAEEAAAALRQLQSTLIGVPPLAPLPPPAAYDHPPRAATLRRPLRLAATRTARVEPPRRLWWKWPLIVMAIVLAVVLVTGTVLGLTVLKPKPKPPPPPPPPVVAVEEDQPLPTGLIVKRAASYDTVAKRITLTLTYTAGSSSLSGPFFERISGLTKDASCPRAAWPGAAPATANDPTKTGVNVSCGWSVPVPVLAAHGSREATVIVDLELPDKDTQQAVQQWLEAESAATLAAITDQTVRGPAFPVQRLKDIKILAPKTVQAGGVVPLTLVPVWASGADPVNVIYGSGEGKPTPLLTAVAGGTQGVRFSDGCAGGVEVSKDGLVVTAKKARAQCRVVANVGNFIQLSSDAFEIKE